MGGVFPTPPTGPLPPRCAVIVPSTADQLLPARRRLLSWDVGRCTSPLRGLGRGHRLSSEVVLRLRWVAGREGTDPQQAWLQATSQTRFHTYATLGCCVTRRYAPAPACAGGHERPVCIGRACDNGARGACALCRTPQGPRPRAAPSRPSRNAHPGALPPVVLQADGGFDCRFKGRWTAGASPALRGPGERGRWGEVQVCPRLQRPKYQPPVAPHREPAAGGSGQMPSLRFLATSRLPRSLPHLRHHRAVAGSAS